MSALDRPVAPHPRLLLTEARVAELRALAATDAFVASTRRAAAGAADALAAAPPLTVPAGGGDLALAERLLRLVVGCGIAWRIDGEQRWYDAVRTSVLAVCSGPAWKRDEFLAIGEVAYAVALGYDWLHARLSPADRATIAGWLRDAVLGAANAAYDDGDWWIDAAINWNHECNGGVIVAALAIADDHPQAARAALGPALRGMAHALDQYEPDGGWDEGAGYWARATHFAVYTLACLETALGDDLGLGDRRGFAGTGDFVMHTLGPTGLIAAYADCNERRGLGSVPPLHWMARRYGRPEYARFALAQAAARGAGALDLVWYAPVADAPLPLDAAFRGAGDAAMMRSAWHDPDALFVWTKGGRNQVNHGHLDLGSFELDALGQRWVRDLGTDDYALPGYFERRPGGRKWSIFRLNSHSHSVPLLDDADQHPWATARITATALGGDDPFAIVDVTEAYHPTANPARRGFRLVGRRALLVQDEFHLRSACRFTWGVTTDAEIALDGRRATLSLGGRRMTATIVAGPDEARFAVASAERPPPEKPNTGVRRLLVDLPRLEGRLRLAVLFAPAWPDGAPLPSPRIEPLGRWA